MFVRSQKPRLTIDSPTMPPAATMVKLTPPNWVYRHYIPCYCKVYSFYSNLRAEDRVQIGELARRTGVTAKTIRFYEDTGLLPAPGRRSNGYRDYAENDEETLHFVVRARALGFSMSAIGELLALWQDRDRTSAEVKRLAETHIAALEARISDLESMRRTLTDLADRCHGDDRPNCPIIDRLATG